MVQQEQAQAEAHQEQVQAEVHQEQVQVEDLTQEVLPEERKWRKRNWLMVVVLFERRQPRARDPNASPAEPAFCRARSHGAGAQRQHDRRQGAHVTVRDKGPERASEK